MNKKAEIVRVYFRPEANGQLPDHCLRSRHFVNVLIAGKHPAPQYGQDMPEIRNWKWMG